MVSEVYKSIFTEGVVGGETIEQTAKQHWSVKGAILKAPPSTGALTFVIVMIWIAGVSLYLYLLGFAVSVTDRLFSESVSFYEAGYLFGVAVMLYLVFKVLYTVLYALYKARDAVENSHS